MTEFNIIPIDPTHHRQMVRNLFDRADDYVMLEKGLAVSEEDVEDFFHETPQGLSSESCRHFGMRQDDGLLVAIASMSIGYPKSDDAYIGLLLIDPEHRRHGLGGTFLQHLLQLAEQDDASRMFIAVLYENRSGRAFWNRQGFTLEHTTPPTRFGNKDHICHRMQRRIG